MFPNKRAKMDNCGQDYNNLQSPSYQEPTPQHYQPSTYLPNQFAHFGVYQLDNGYFPYTPDNAPSHWSPPPPSPIYTHQGYPLNPTAEALSPILANSEIDGSRIFKEISSCVSIMEGNARKVKVTIGELRRRMGSPEFMESSQLARLTRHTKSTVRDFERRFTKAGFDVLVNKGQSRSGGILSMLLEAEALILARDFTKLISSELSTSLLAATVVGAAENMAPAMQHHAQAIRTHLSCIKAHLLSAGREPDELSTLEKDGRAIDPAVKEFSLHTHGLGPLVAVAVIESLMAIMVIIEKTTLRSSENEALDFSSSSLDDSGLGCSFHYADSPTTAVAAQAHDLDLTSSHSDDHLVYSLVAPRIAFDGEQIELTIGELRRRAQSPEKFTVGKKSHTHSALRQSLAEYGITINSSKGLTPTSWSSLSESEAGELAAETAAFLSVVTASTAMRERKEANQDAAAWLSFIARTIQSAMERVGRLPGEGTVESEVDKSVARFALITHHFGHSFYASVMQWIQDVT